MIKFMACGLVSFLRTEKISSLMQVGSMQLSIVDQTPSISQHLLLLIHVIRECQASSSSKAQTTQAGGNCTPLSCKRMWVRSNYGRCTMQNFELSEELLTIKEPTSYHWGLREDFGCSPHNTTCNPSSLWNCHVDLGTKGACHYRFHEEEAYWEFV